MILGYFLAERAAHQGPWHCSSMAADWCIALGHPDFAAQWRGVSDPDECEHVQVAAGGLMVLWLLGIGEALPHVAEPLRAGDIAIVRVMGHDKGAIWTGARWAIEGEREMHFLAPEHAELVGAWRP